MLRVSFLLFGAARAWGPEGHEIVAHLAESLCSKETIAKFSVLLNKDGSKHLADVAAWADVIRNKWPWSEPLHFIDLPDDVCEFDWERDCHDQHGNKNFCVAGSVQNYTNRLADLNLPEQERIVALKMLVHFVGDIHQPLHCGFTSDRGGNTEKVVLVYDHKHKQALHGVWDSEIIDMHEVKSHWKKHEWEKVAEELAKKYLEPNSSEDGMFYKCGAYSHQEPYDCLMKMARESGEFMCNTSMVHADGTRIKNGDKLTEKYFEKAWPVVEERLVAGGVRLHQILESVFAGIKLEEEEHDDDQTGEGEGGGVRVNNGFLAKQNSRVVYE